MRIERKPVEIRPLLFLMGLWLLFYTDTETWLSLLVIFLSVDLGIELVLHE